MTKMQHTLKIKEIEISSGQYLPSEFGDCHAYHGHNYIIKNMILKTEGIVDFKKIKTYLKTIDHCTFAPQKDKLFWDEMIRHAHNWCFENKIELPCLFKIAYIPIGDIVTAEYLALSIQSELLTIEWVKEVHFELFETKNNGVIV